MLAHHSPTLASRQLGEAIRLNIADHEVAASLRRAFDSRPKARGADRLVRLVASRPPAPSAAALALAHDLHCLVALGGRQGGAWARRWLSPTRLSWARQLGDWARVCARVEGGGGSLAAALNACAPPGAWAPPLREAAATELMPLWRRYLALAGDGAQVPRLRYLSGRSLGAWHLAAARTLAQAGPAAPVDQLATWVRRCPSVAEYAAR